MKIVVCLFEFHWNFSKVLVDNKPVLVEIMAWHQTILVMTIEQHKNFALLW